MQLRKTVHTETLHKLSNFALTMEELELTKYGLKHPRHPSSEQNRYSDNV